MDQTNFYLEIDSGVGLY